MKAHKAIILGCLLLNSVASVSAELPGTPKPAEASASTTQESTSDRASALIMRALSLVGVKYKFGGRSPESGLDCSGFVGYVFRSTAGLALPHNAYAISMVGSKISTSELRPGDLVFFKTLSKTFSHVGIYLGENRFIHATSSKTGTVSVSDMSESYWAKRFNGARRIDSSSLSSATDPESTAAHSAQLSPLPISQGAFAQNPQLR